MYVRNIPSADDSEEEENRNSSYELTRVLAKANMTTGGSSPKMVLLGTEKIGSKCFLESCR